LVTRQEEEVEQKKKSIRIHVGLTRFLLVRSEFSPNWTVSSVFDSFRQQTSIGHNFCIRTPFLTCDHSKCSEQKVLSSKVAVRPPERSEFPKESEKFEFLASEVLDPKISADLHLYLAFELFLSACCAAP
jgi:hypothetical protein